MPPQSYNLPILSPERHISPWEGYLSMADFLSTWYKKKEVSEQNTLTPNHNGGQHVPCRCAREVQR